MFRRKKPVLQRPALILSARRSTWSAEEIISSADMARLTQEVLKRDDHTCLFCGFRAETDQELHHKNDDHGDYELSNLAVICNFCHMSFHIGRVGLTGEAELIWLPELPQQSVNHLARAIFVALRGDPVERAGAEALYSALRARADDARRRLGTSDPADLGEAMLALEDGEYAKRAEKLAGLKLLPLGRRIVDDKDVFPDILRRWTSGAGPFARMLPPQWDEILSRLDKGGVAATAAT